MTWRTHAAKAVYTLGGWLSRVKSYQRVYSMNWDDPDADPEFTPAGRCWLSCNASLKLLKWSEHIDPGHWEHWALMHDDCPAIPCPSCGGYLCPDEE
jgi:hypothetical protein